MAVNQSHTENRRAALIPQGESVLNQCHDVNLSFLQQPRGSNLFSGTKNGTLFLTSYRVIFVTSRSVNDPMCSFMMPFDLMSNCTVEQPVFAPNYIKGTVEAAPDGGWEGQATFKLAFRKGGAIQFFQLMMRASSAAAQGVPLQSVNYWFGVPGLYVISGQGTVMRNQERPCQAYPVVVHGPQPVRHGAPPGTYGTPPPGYGAPPPGYGVPPVGYGVPPVGYGVPPVGYGVPPVGYEALPEGHGAPPEGPEAPPVGCRAPPAGNEALPVGYGPPPNEALPPGYDVSPARNRAGFHNSVAAQPARYEASLPSTSSSQAHSPPSKQ